MARYQVPGGLVLLAVVVGACAKQAAVVEAKGECGVVFNGEICTWSRTQGTTVVAVGADVPVASIQNAPQEADMAWPPKSAAILQLPAAVQQATGLTQLTVYWEAAGHPPGPYMTPHFDFHFYTIPHADQAAIDCADVAKPATLATGYSLPDQPLPPDMAKMIGVSTLVGICVPGMGMHSLLTAELERKDVFRGSVVLGYYHGKPIFVEPMLTRALLDEKRSFDLPIPAAIPGMAGAYPRNFHAEYDAQAQVYHFVFTNFVAGS